LLVVPGPLQVREGIAMAVVKVIELLAESEQSWEDAARRALDEAGKSLRGISSIYIKDFQATVENDRIKTFRVTAKVSFLIEKS
jgi:flavin-binding protein dodecin